MKLAIAALVLLLVACGGDSSEALPTENGLRDYLTSYWSDFQKGDVAKLYARLPEETRKTCTFSEYSGNLLLASAFFGESFKKAEFRVTNVRIDGVNATYDTSLVLDGAELSAETGNQATYLNGTWVVIDQDGESTDGC